MTIHNIPPLFNGDSEILILGSFPSVKSRESQFFYAHPQNRFWRVTSAVFECETPKTIFEKKKMLLLNRTALWDVIGKCEVSGSSDSSIIDAVPNDIAGIISQSRIKKIYLNGKTAAKYYDRFFGSLIKAEAVCLPSTSPANAACSLDMLISCWKIIAKP